MKFYPSCPIVTAERHYQEAVKDGNLKAAAKYMAQYKAAVAATYAN